jgi:hypothetical protein
MVMEHILTIFLTIAGVMMLLGVYGIEWNKNNNK